MDDGTNNGRAAGPVQLDLIIPVTVQVEEAICCSTVFPLAPRVLISHCYTLDGIQASICIGTQ